MPDEQHQETAETDGGPPPVRAGTEDALFAENVRNARTSLGMSQGELARRMSDLGWPWYQQTVRRLEAGTRKASVGEAQTLARILGTSTARLTMPGRQASAAALLGASVHKAEEAWDQIAEWSAVLTRAQRQLALTASQAENDKLIDSPYIRTLLGEARQALSLTPESAVADGLERDREMLAELTEGGDGGHQASGGEAQDSEQDLPG